MNILVFSQYYYPEHFSITNICEELVKEGNQVTVLTGLPCYGSSTIFPGYRGPMTETIKGVVVHRVKVHPRGKSAISLIRNYLSFWSNSKHYAYRTKEQFDVVYSICLSPIIGVSAANIYAKKHHIRHVHHCLDVWPESAVATNIVRKNSLLYFLLLVWSKKIYGKMDEILVSSPCFEDYLRNVIGLKKTKIVFVPQPALTVASVKEEAFSYSKAINLVYAGNIGTLQEVDSLVKACILAHKKTEFDFHIFGSGSCEEDVKKIVKQGDAEQYIHFYGQIPPEEIGRYLSSACAFLLCLKNVGGAVASTIPNKLVTYLSFGKPIIAALPEGDGSKIAKEAGGCFVTNSSVISIAKAIVDFVSLPEETRTKMGFSNRQFFLLSFSCLQIVRKIEAEIAC